MRAGIGAIAVAAAAIAAAGAAAWASRKRGGQQRGGQLSGGRKHSGRAAAGWNGAGPASTGERSRASTPEVVAIAVVPAEAPLTSLKGLGAVSEERLGEIGVTTIAQIAAWSDDDVEAIAQQIKVSAERIRREDWVGQARATAKA